MYESILAWVKEQQRLISNDWDNVMLFTGREGVGKSTWMFQVMRALDPYFTSDQMHFQREDFLQASREGGKGRGYAWDEANLLKRRAMHGSTLEVLDHLQVCRGLNQHLAIAFPHESLLDDAVKDHRIRWNWHIEKRGIAWLRVRRKGTYRGRDVFKWHKVQAFGYKKNSGPLWDAYLAKKKLHMEGADLPRPDKPQDKLGIDWDRGQGVVADLVAICNK